MIPVESLGAITTSIDALVYSSLTNAEVTACSSGNVGFQSCQGRLSSTISLCIPMMKS